MQLHFTLIGPGRKSRDVCEDLVAEVPEQSTGGELAAQLALCYGATKVTVEGRPLESLTVGEPPLRNGALLLAEGASPVSRPDSRLELVVRTGPAAGSSFSLGRGMHVIGRSWDSPAPADIPLPDADVSRHHAKLIITETSARIIDAGSANGTWIGGRRVRTAKLRVGDPMRVGSSTITLEFPGESRLDDTAGRHYGEPLRVERQDGPRRGTAVAMTVLPLAVGIGMALATGQWTFLAFSSVSVVTLLIAGLGARGTRLSFGARLAQAVVQDLARRMKAAPDAADFCRSAGSPAPPGTARSPGTAREDVLIRLGTAPQLADVAVQPPDGRAIRIHASAPVTVPLSRRLAVGGQVDAVEGLIRFVLLQLASAPAGSGLDVLLAGGTKPLRRAARYLPRVRVLPEVAIADPAAMAAHLPTEGGAVVILPGPDRSATLQLATSASARGLGVIDCTGAHESADSELRLGNSRASLLVNGTRTELTVDLVPAQPFETAARKLGNREQAHDGGTAPARCGLDEVAGLTEDDLIGAWRQGMGSRNPRGEAASVWIPLGRGASGAIGLDLVADGPHVLVAGTTGSGKSELLRTIVCAAAAVHSPATLTFLFIDFKGGSGLAPLVGLPHCVGLVTDLEGSTERMLMSLRAEVARRERLLAAAGCADIADYAARESDELTPRLVIVVDEFRMLVDDAPESLAELMRVATIGRSLGIHLVMATQRPQGALSADIRANVASTIALRVASESESRDVLGTPDAARIPSSLPGRAILSAAGRPPVEFQTASLGLATERNAETRIVPADEWLRVGARGAGAPRPSPEEAAEPFVTAAQRAWRELGGQLPKRPVAELPADPAGPGPLSRSRRVPLGIADRPHEQRTDVLRWGPETHGHLALVGAPVSGTRAALAAVAAQLAAGTPHRHLYILDGDGSLAGLAEHPRVGAYVGIGDLRLAARVLERLGEESSDRRADSRSAPSKGRPPLVLILSAWGSWISAWRQSPQAWAEEQLLDLVRDGGLSGLAIIASGDRDLAASRGFGGIPCRLFFPWGSTDESRLGWPRLPVGRGGPGRAIAAGALSPDRPIVVHCFDAPTEKAHAVRGLAADAALVEDDTPPFRVRPLPTVVPAIQLVRGGLVRGDLVRGAQDEVARETTAQRESEGRRQIRLTIGLHGDDASPLALGLSPGGVLLVLGSPDSGKSSFLDALPIMNPGAAVWHRRPESQSGWAEAIGGAVDAANCSPAVLLVDDADRLSAAENQRLRSALESGVAIVATAAYSPNLYSHCPLALPARSTRTGIAIRPRSSADGDAFGVRLDPPGNAPRGRALAIVDGQAVDVQLGWAGQLGADSALNQAASDGRSAA